MENAKPKTTHVDVPEKTSPRTPRSGRQTKTKGTTPDSAASPNPPFRTPKERSPKIPERKLARSSAPEKRQSGHNRTQELESELNQLQEDLKKVKEQLSSSESQRRRAQQEAEDTRSQLLAASGKRDGDPCSDTDELQNLKLHLEAALKSEAVQSERAEAAEAEVQKLRQELEDALSSVGRMLVELAGSRESENRALEAEKVARAEGEKAKASVLDDLRRSKEQVESLELSVRKLQDENTPLAGDGCSDELGKLQEELRSANLEVGRMRAALDLAEVRWLREAELQAEVEKAMAETDALRGELEEKKQGEAEGEVQLQRAVEENEMLKAEIRKGRAAEREWGAQAELEAEVRRLKVQSDQWRKAAEAATAMLSDGDSSRKMFSRNGSVEGGLVEKLGLGSLNSEGGGGEGRNEKILRRIGGIWKKGHK